MFITNFDLIKSIYSQGESLKRSLKTEKNYFMIYVIFDNFFCFIGLLTGGKVEHQCSLDRSIGYYLEPLMCLGAFCKNPLEVNLFGVSNNQNDPSPDLLKCSAMPILKRSKYV